MAACQRDQTVHAGNESDTYQPRPAPKVGKTTNNHTKQEMSGELISVDIQGKTLEIRLPNGMVQTFRFNTDTSVRGLENQPQSNAAKPGGANKTAVHTLVGKEGSEVTVSWTGDENNKLARSIDVTQVTTKKNVHPARKRR